MPWRECSVTEERLRFVARLLEGEGMSEVCRDFGISAKLATKRFAAVADALVSKALTGDVAAIKRSPIASTARQGFHRLRPNHAERDDVFPRS